MDVIAGEPLFELELRPRRQVARFFCAWLAVKSVLRLAWIEKLNGHPVSWPVETHVCPAKARIPVVGWGWAVSAEKSLRAGWPACPSCSGSEPAVAEVACPG